MSGPTVSATSSGAAVAQHSAASAGHQGAAPILHAPIALGGFPGQGGVSLHTQSLAQTPQPGTSLWSTMPPQVTQIGGPASSLASAPITSEAARAALFMSQLAAVHAASQTAMLLPMAIPPPAYAALRTEGPPSRQSRSYSQATAASNRNEIWIPYSPSTIGSYSPYPHIRPPEMCFECNRTHTRATSARHALLASSGRRCLAGLRRGRKMRRRGPVTARQCFSPRGRR